MDVILNADDYGRSSTINAAVIRAHRCGVLTSASLIVTGEAVAEAVSLAKEAPSLAVGLHVVVADGQAALGPSHIPLLVDDQGRFPSDPLRTGLRYFFQGAVREELARELEAQFECFAATGLSLSHVDGHMHMHLHPIVFKLLLPMAERYGAHGLRLPRDEFWRAICYDRQRAGLKASWAITFGLLCRWCVRQMHGAKLATAHRVHGLMQTGQMQEAYVTGLLRSMRVPTAELYFHPSTVAEGGDLGPNPGDLATLLSPTVRNVLQEGNVRLATYSTLGRG